MNGLLQQMPKDMVRGLVAMKLAAPGVPLMGEALAGGVASDIWRAVLPVGEVCVKRALPKLKVAADWHVPTERNIYEARWLRLAASVVPGAVPELLGQDAETGTLAMRYLPPDDHPVWKTRLRNGAADPAFAAEVGRRLALIQSASTRDPGVPEQFPATAIFLAIRLDPYLLATAEAHPDLREQLQALVHTTSTTRLALVHGDVSPKNILCGPDGPVFIDAECAWWGDPAFDIAFCLKLLMLKCLWVPDSEPGYMACFTALSDAYLAGATWEPADRLEARAAALLPGLFLARVDGKSPVEYVTDEAAKDKVRRVGRALIRRPPERLEEVRLAWEKELHA
jgi:aminoglycoside phosphotransferase (APT) family kinase protein